MRVCVCSESDRLQQDLQKVEQLETKITGELNTLKEKILQMREGLETYSNLDALKKSGEDKKKVSEPTARGLALGLRDSLTNLSLPPSLRLPVYVYCCFPLLPSCDLSALVVSYIKSNASQGSTSFST